MIGKLGFKIFNAVRKNFPLTTGGISTMPKNLKFNMNNPCILEVLPENRIGEFVKFNGQDLQTVCKQLDNVSKGFDRGELKLLWEKAFPAGKVPGDSNCDAIAYLSALPESICAKFDAHGIAKISIPNHLEQLNNLLTNGIDKTRTFCTAPLSGNPLAGSGLGCGGSAYRGGSFIVVGEKSKLLENSGIKHVIVNDAYYNIVEDLQQKFPDVNFVRADNAVKYFTKLAE